MICKVKRNQIKIDVRQCKYCNELKSHTISSTKYSQCSMKPMVCLMYFYSKKTVNIIRWIVKQPQYMKQWIDMLIAYFVRVILLCSATSISISCSENPKYSLKGSLHICTNDLESWWYIHYRKEFKIVAVFISMWKFIPTYISISLNLILFMVFIPIVKECNRVMLIFSCNSDDFWNVQASKQNIISLIPISLYVFLK